MVFRIYLTKKHLSPDHEDTSRSVLMYNDHDIIHKAGNINLCRKETFFTRTIYYLSVEIKTPTN